MPVRVSESLESPGVRAPGVVDEAVHASQSLGRARDEIPYLLRVGDVCPLRVSDRSVPAQLVGGGEHLVLAP